MADRRRKQVEYRMDKGIHVGGMLRAFMDKKSVNQAAIARRASMTPQALSGMLNRPSMHTEILTRLSEVLEHDFFAELSAELRARKLIVVDPKGQLGKPDRRIEVTFRMEPEQLDRVTRLMEAFDRFKED